MTTEIVGFFSYSTNAQGHWPSFHMHLQTSTTSWWYKSTGSSDTTIGSLQQTDASL